MIIRGGAGSQFLVGTSGADTIYGYDPNGAGAVNVTPLTNPPSLTSPLFATYAPGDGNGLYIVQKGGAIVRYDSATGVTSSFLNVTDISTGGERGVLSIAFHPDYNSNGRFFVFATDADGDIEIREYARNGGPGSTVANAAEVRTILTIEHSSSNYHNGGSMAFSPTNGLLYIGVGDAQNGDNSQDGGNLLGKILRIDVNSTDFAGSTTRYYHVPPSNYFAGGGDGVNDAIFAMGLRNPWRISFDASGNLWIGEVGEDDYEEIDFIANGSNGGQNFGWPVREGAHVFEGGTLGPGVLTDPLYEYSHAVGQSITGGFVYNGPAPGLQGKYIFGDFITGKIYALEKVGDSAVVTEITSMLSSPIGGGQLASFGLDAQQNLYVVKFGGEVVMLTPQAAGADGADTLDGGAGADTLIGGPGDDVYITDEEDTVIEEPGEGTDTIRTEQNAYTLTFADVENVTFIGSGAFSVTGNALANVLTGGGGADTLSGGGGADTLIGGAGNDVYNITNAVTTIIEGSGAGVDTVRSSVNTYTLGGNLDNLVLLSAAVNGYGNGQNNLITGNGNANILKGFAGSDTLDGGGGVDTVNYIDANGAVTVLAGSQAIGANQGADTLISIENLVGSNFNDFLIGNAAANVLNGALGNDTLNGGAGADTLIGSAGDDTYIVDNAGDVTTEIASTHGYDWVQASVDWTLGAYIERLTLMGSADLSGAGNAQANLIEGNSGRNILDGGAGADTMIGGAGGDDYYVDNTGDVTTELVNQGADRLFSSVHRTLSANIESLTLTGTANLSGAGNVLDNVINGNSGDNTLNGNLGADSLRGGLGADNFLFNTAIGGGNVDRILDFNVTDDTIVLENSIFSALTASGALNSGNFRKGAGAADANDFIIYQVSTGALFYDADGNGAGAQIQFATLNPNLALTAQDFLIV